MASTDLHVNGLEVGVGAVVFLATFVGSIAVTAVILTRLPATYFCEASGSSESEQQRPHLVRRVLKNVLGALLVAAGLVMSVPGVPGQGILTILVGLLLLDIPGKRDLERRLACRPRVFRTLNGLRARFGKSPFVHP